MEFDNIIANPPYGRIGANITDKVIKTVKYKEFVNLEPGNDYFITGTYKYIDAEKRPIILKNGAFADAEQTTVACYLSEGKENDLTELDARILVHIVADTVELRDALTEYIYKVAKVGALNFSSGLMRRHTAVTYDPKYFTFNAGAYEIIGGGLQLKAQKGSGWSISTRYNVFREDIVTGSDVPSAEVKGCSKFVKLMYSELGLKIIKLLFGASPEGWGFRSFFADIDYSDCDTWTDVFTKLEVSNDSQTLIINAAEKLTLTDKEYEICRIVKETF